MRVMRYILLVVSLFVLSGYAGAEERYSSAVPDMRGLFVNMPDTVLPLLTRNNRLDMLDYLDSGMEAVVTNRLGGNSALAELRDDGLTLYYTSVSNIQMKLFYRKDSTAVVCLVRSYRSDDVSDCCLELYDTEWNRLDKSLYIKEPSFEDYVVKDYRRADSLAELERACDLHPVVIGVSQSHPLLTFRSGALDYLDEGADRFRPFFREKPLYYRWTGKRFRLF